MRAPSETRRKKESIDFLDDTGFLQMRHPANHFYTNLIEPYSTLFYKNSIKIKFHQVKKDS
jgi:hypothetical protein